MGLRLSQSEIKDIRFSHHKVIGGESGSPLIGFSDVESFDIADLEDERNKLLSLPERARLHQDYTHPHIKGHVLSYHRTIRESKYLSEESFFQLQEQYLNGHRGNTSGTLWRYENGISYRTSENIQEAFFGTNYNSGNGTKETRVSRL